ncbi:MAG: hypothetical protein JXR48_06415 [Candidatus Delongbacteria bacterium]|nr:hypothetical protein [Candidatus Delongbacteria bacterium]MBN2834584.1 hypothetical protein [Candidatus Delongbacteria bacterium]
MFRVVSILMVIIILISCEKKVEKQNIESTIGPISVKKYETPTGVDPNVPDYQGGAGFELISDSLGFLTNNDFETFGDPNAVKGGTFKSYVSYFPSTYRGAGKGSNEASISTLNSYVYERLMGWDKDYKFTPVLASHWKLSEDQMTYWFRIDPEARWNDGKPVVAEDVYYTWKLLTDESTLDPYTVDSYNKFDMEVESKYIIKITSKESGWKQFLMVAIWMDIYPAHHLKKVNGTTYLEKYHYMMLPGTGPYVLNTEKTIKGTRMVISRRSDYWAENKFWNKGFNNFDELNYEVIMDDNLAFEKFKKGDIDYYSVTSSNTWKNSLDYENPGPGLDDILTRNLIKKKKIYNHYPKSFNGFAFNMRKAPFDDIRVRQAFAKLFNRDQILEKIEMGEQKKIRSHWPWGIYENKNNVMIDYDPEGAAKLLDEAGFNHWTEDGLRYHSERGVFELTLNIMTDREKYYTPFQEDLRKAGIKLNLKLCDFPTMLQMYNSRQFELIWVNWYPAGAPNLTAKFSSKLADLDDTNNMTGIKDKRLDEISELYNAEFDPIKRIRYIQETDSIAYNMCHYAMGYKAKWSGRVVYWDKFGMPEWVWGYRYGGTTSMWWFDKDKEEKLNKAINDKSIVLDREDEIADYWKLR